MELDAIHVFVKVVEVGSFSGAAKILKMPKTTVSAKVATLERRLGVTLIQRTTRKLHVTEAGETFFRHCALAIKEIETGEALLSEAQETPRGRLRVTAPADFGHSVLPQIVCEYLRKYPDTEVEMIVTNRVVDLVGEGIDVAIRAGELRDSTLVARKYFDSRLALFAAPAYLKKSGTPSEPSDLARHRFMGHIAFAAKSIELYDGKDSATITVRPKVVADDFEALRSLILLKEGLGFLPEYLAAPAVKEKELVPVLARWALKVPGSFWFVYPGQKYSVPKVRAFIELAKAHVTA